MRSIYDMHLFVDSHLRLTDDAEVDDWRDERFCNTSQHDFLADDPSPEAVAVCAACPVRVECLVDDQIWVRNKAYDLTHVDELPTLREHPDLNIGTRGGLSGRQRELLNKVNYRRMHVLAECYCGNWFTHLLGAELGEGKDGVGTPSSRGCSLDCIRSNSNNTGIERLDYDPDMLPAGIKSRSVKLAGL